MNPNQLVYLSPAERTVLQQAEQIKNRVNNLQATQLESTARTVGVIPNDNILPPQKVIRVNGKASVDSIKMSPNSEAIMMDTTAPMVWLCVSDGVGSVTSTPYDISLHVDAPPIDVESLASRVTNLETVLTNLLGGSENGKEQSNDGAVERHEDDKSAK